jgi:hypothetical protein
MLLINFKHVGRERPLGDEIEMIFRGAKKICATVIGGVSAPIFRYTTITPVN